MIKTHIIVTYEGRDCNLRENRTQWAMQIFFYSRKNGFKNVLEAISREQKSCSHSYWKT